MFVIRIQHKIILTISILFQCLAVLSQDFPTSFPWINDTVYIAGASSKSGDGSREKPYNSWDEFSFKSRTAYLFKRGDTLEVFRKVSIGVDSVYFGGYGSGARPLFYGTTTNKHLCFYGTQQYIQGINIQCQDTGTCITFTGDTAKCDFLWADSMELSSAWWGTNPYGYGKIILSNLYIHRIRVDGIFSSHNDTIIIKNTKIHDVNRWYDWKQDIGSSGGDCIQGESNGYVVIEDCMLDHSDMPGKFAIIQNGADTVTVKNSTLIGYEGSSAVYLGKTSAGWCIDACKIIGGNYGLFNKTRALVKNCVFSDCGTYSICGSNMTIYNCTFANQPEGKVLKGWTTGGWKVYNCLFYNVTQIFSASESYVWASNNNYYNDSTFSEQPLTPWGDNVTSYKPLFKKDNGSYDFFLQENSMLIDAGADLSLLGVDKDINGKSRPNGNGYEIGAYEYYSDEDNNTSGDNPDFVNADIVAFPNPSSGEFTIKSSGGAIRKLIVFSVSGEKLLSEKVPGLTEYKLDLSNRKTGIYCVKVWSDNQGAVLKLLKK